MLSARDIVIFILDEQGRNSLSCLPRKERLVPLARRYLALCGEKEMEQGGSSCWETAKGPWGKPYFIHQPGLFFSISHSGRFWVCAFGGHALGVDIQQHRCCRRDRLSARFFHPTEDAYLRGCGYEEFFAVWAAKESRVKYLGASFLECCRTFSVVAERADEGMPHLRPRLELARSLEGAFLRHLPGPEGYSLCLCGERAERIFLGSVAQDLSTFSEFPEKNDF